MVDMKSSLEVPSLIDISHYVRNGLFDDFCHQLETEFRATIKIEFSKCSWEYGWNVKFKNRGKNLCTLYLRENYFTVLVVIGTKEQPVVANMLSGLCPEIREIYHQTVEGNGQRWLLIDLEDRNNIYEDTLMLITTRFKS